MHEDCQILYAARLAHRRCVAGWNRPVGHTDMSPDYYRSLYRWYREHGICTCCHQRDAEPGKSLCYECAEKKRQQSAGRRADPERRASIRAKKKARYQQARQEGRCIICGKDAYRDKSYCYEHWLSSIRIACERYKERQWKREQKK